MTTSSDDKRNTFKSERDSEEACHGGNEGTLVMVNDSEFQEMNNSDESLLVTNELEYQEEEKPGEDLTPSVLSDTCTGSDVNQEDEIKEPGNPSEDSDTDYEERLSNKGTEEAEQHTEVTQGCEDSNGNSLTGKEPCLELTDEKEKEEDSSRLADSENEQPDKSELLSEDPKSISSPKVKLLDLDNREEGNSYTEREIYETQLLQLQHQLVAIMIQEQEKSMY
jgi:hypothetical protein